ncbi:putative F0F1-ATPase subunit (Ca2+/Mg2+ transporter) [Alkalibaculum bacchi]|uniref:Putative F0F1-ATPase subunit (Ca2+/Mg2+ transporter) n=1 Tax=Alkalibaculum bacchi TaxID=645887 RepID=A0A366I8Y3_9FIRM|nr:AtpZ/AtpI family protein [Alkalibaculum bacchi]RBP65986.1 putative F0F1-ATPase subunit (Ca2+/Mg2+ transporter) [Alkalibaculum bacchi]
MSRNKKHPLANLALLTHIGISMFVPIIGCFFLGKYLDTVFSTGNILLLIFTILGVLTAFRNLFAIGLESGPKRKDDTYKRIRK